VSLGVDVPGEAFGANTKRIQPNEVGMPGTLQTWIPQMEKPPQAVEAAGLRGFVRAIAGGASSGRSHTRRPRPTMRRRTPTLASWGSSSGSVHARGGMRHG